MSSLTNLKFDDTVMDTRLAEEYLKADNEFRPFGCDTKEAELETDVTLGKSACNIFYSSFDDVFHLDYPHGKCTEKAYTGRRIARKIEENSNLFSQLEYLIRNIPIDETKMHIELIVQQIRCTDIIESYQHDGKYYLLMSDNTPLFNLGCMALQCYNDRIGIILMSSVKTAALCRLFAQLCHEVGLKIFLVYVKDSTVHDLHFHVDVIDVNAIKELNSGCTGIITERSDLDSAVDVFLSSTRTSPWKLRRILIQESVYEAFKKIITWKWTQRRVKIDSDQKTVDSYRLHCTDVFLFNGNVFLLDYAGPAAAATNLVMVEAYRTTKELLGLLKMHDSCYLSLWSSDASEYNGIAFEAASPVVWVNEYATFHGPPAASNCIFSIIYTKLRTRRFYKCNVIEELCDLSESWMKIKFERRVDIMSDALKKFLDTADDKNVSSLNIAKLSLDDVFNLQSNTFIDFGDGKICTGIKRPIGVVLLESLDESIWRGILKSVVYGNAFGIHSDRHKTLIETFKKYSIPIVFYNNWFGCDFEVTCEPYTLYRCKTIWSNYGSVFAN